MVETVGTLEAAVMVALVAVGVLFLAVGTVGLLRFPNVYNRMHATSKPTTLGTAAIFAAAFVRFGPGNEGLSSLLGVAFLFLTVPTGAHMIARSAERMGVPFEAGVTWPAPPELYEAGTGGAVEDDEGDSRSTGDSAAGRDGDEAEDAGADAAASGDAENDDGTDAGSDSGSGADDSAERDAGS